MLWSFPSLRPVGFGSHEGRIRDQGSSDAARQFPFGRRLEKKTEILGAVRADEHCRRDAHAGFSLGLALGLGRLSVQSALGEAMQAEIEVTSMTAEEQANLRIRVAPPEAYRAANVDYNPVLPTTRRRCRSAPTAASSSASSATAASRNPSSTSSSRSPGPPAAWFREYTLLFDPPAAQRAPAIQAQAAPRPPRSSPPRRR
jgi:hypothetical protein